MSPPADAAPPRSGAAPIVLRRFPQPYRAMLAVCSDIDGARPDTFRETHRFLNTAEDTAVGRGVGLDIADSCWFYQSPFPFREGTEQLAYFTDYTGTELTRQADELLNYMKAGWIDTLHTYGNFSGAGRFTSPFARRHAIDALKILQDNGIALKVWVNHGDDHNRQNIGTAAYMQGDNPGSAEYHTDLLRAYGTEYLWAHGRTDCEGQTTAVHDLALRDGGRIFSFYRFNWRSNAPQAQRIATEYGLPYQRRDDDTFIQVWHPRALKFQLAEEVLQGLVDNGHFCVLGQHLGFMHPLVAFDDETVAAFRRLRRFQDDGLILVARTARLLHYNRVRDHLEFSVRTVAGRDVVDIEAVTDPVRGRWLPQLEDLRGITFEGTGSRPIELRLRRAPIDTAEIDRSPATGASTGAVGIRWFTPDLTDYAIPYLRAARSSYVLWNPQVRQGLRQRNAKVLAFLEHERDAAAPGGQPAQDAGAYRASVNYALRRYRAGLPHYTAAFERIGFTGMRNGLDVGSGVGHWSLAFLEHSERVLGIDRDASNVAVAARIAAHSGYAARAEYIAGEAEELIRQDNAFDCAWAHSVLMHVADAEKIVFNIARALRKGGYFYCGYSTDGLQLRAVGIQIEGKNSEALARNTTIYLNGCLNRCGIFRTPGARNRMLRLEDLLRISRVFGLTYVGQPGIHDAPGEFLDIPATVDFIVCKTAEPDEVRRRLMAGSPVETADWRDDLEQIMRSGCPGLVCDVLRTADPELNDPANRDLCARSLIRAGRAGDPAAAALFDRGGLGDLAMGLYCHDRGRISEALSCYQRLEPSCEDRAFLIGCCLLQLEDWPAARRLFEGAVGNGDAAPREYIGLLAAHYRAGDLAAAARTFQAFIDSRPRPPAVSGDKPASAGPDPMERPAIAIAIEPSPPASPAARGATRAPRAMTSDQMIRIGHYSAEAKLDSVAQLWEGGSPEVQQRGAVDHHRRPLLPKWVDRARHGGSRAVDRYLDRYLASPSTPVAAVGVGAPERSAWVLRQLQESGRLPPRGKIIDDLVDQITHGGWRRRPIRIDALPPALTSRLCEVFAQGMLEELAYTEDEGEVPSLAILRRRAIAFPAEFLAGRASALCVFTTAFLGKADVIYVYDAAIRDVTLVDLDEIAMNKVRQMYPPHWSYIVSDYRSFLSAAVEQRRRYDLVTADPPAFAFPDMRDRSLRDLLLLTDRLIISLGGPEILDEMGFADGTEAMSRRFSEKMGFPLSVRHLLRRGNTDRYWVVFDR
jgi:SAM-dependent methyltransferase